MHQRFQKLAKEQGLIWMTFNLQGPAPSTYKGLVRWLPAKPSFGMALTNI